MWNTSAGVEIRQENPVSNPAQVDSESKVETGEEKKPDGENNSPLMGVIKKIFKAISFEKMNTTRRQKPHKHQKLMGVKPNDGFGGADLRAPKSKVLQAKKPPVKSRGDSYKDKDLGLNILDELSKSREEWLGFKKLGSLIRSSLRFDLEGWANDNGHTKEKIEVVFDEILEYELCLLETKKLIIRDGSSIRLRRFNETQDENDKKNLDGENKLLDAVIQKENPINIPTVDSESKVENEEKKNPDGEDKGAHNWIKATGLVASLGGLSPPTPPSSSASPSHFLMALLAVSPLAVLARFILHLFYCDEWGRRLLLLTSSWCIFSFLIWYFLI